MNGKTVQPPPESGRLEMALEGPGTRAAARGLSEYPWGLKLGSEPAPGALARRLRETLIRENCSQQVFAFKLHVAKAQVGYWLKGRFPKRRYWPALVKAGIATEGELQVWRPRRRRHDPKAPRPAAWFVRRAGVYNLRVVAAALRMALITAGLLLRIWNFRGGAS